MNKFKTIISKLYAIAKDGKTIAAILLLVSLSTGHVFPKGFDTTVVDAVSGVLAVLSVVVAVYTEKPGKQKNDN